MDKTLHESLQESALTHIRNTFALALAAVSLSGIASSAFAGDYAIISLGKSRFGNPANLWHNFEQTTAYGYSSAAQERSNTWSIGLGRRYGWGAVEFAYHDFGETKSFAGYPYDPGSPQLPAGCSYPCTAPQWVYHYGTAQGISLAVVPEHRLTRNTALFLKAGVVAYRATFEYHIADTYANPDARAANVMKWPSTYGLSLSYGFGVRYKIFALEANRYPDVAAVHPEHNFGNFQQVDTVTLSLQLPI